jgi:excisionase family DNA binding protein
MTDGLLTLEEVAAYLKVSKQHAWRLTRPDQTKGEPMPTIRFGHSVRVRESDLDAWLARRTAARA